MRQFIYLSVAAVVMALFTSCDKKNNNADAPVQVKTITVAQTNEAEGTCYSGTIEENSGTAVSFATAGKVQKVFVENGQAVSKGQLIATLDPISLTSAHNAALSMLRQAQDAYARMKKLHDTKSISEMQWVEVQSKLEQAQSSEQMARRALQDVKVVAPCSGVIADKMLEPGQNVLPTITVMKIVEINKVKVSLSVPENEVSGLYIGQMVNVTVPAVGAQVFTGKITEKDVTANSLSRTYFVKATIDNPGRKLMPGMICDAVINNGKVANNMTLPLDAVQLSDKNFYFVWIVNNGKARKKFVNVGTVTNGGVIVESGLSRGDKVIIEGQQKVCDNMKVTEK